jgi:hypothetical protein
VFLFDVAQAIRLLKDGAAIADQRQAQARHILLAHQRLNLRVDLRRSQAFAVQGMDRPGSLRRHRDQQKNQQQTH